MAQQTPARGLPGGRARITRAVSTALCVLSLLFGTVWPAVPMPPAWARAAAAWPAQLSHCTGNTARNGQPQTPAPAERDSRLNCPVCSLALGWSGTPQPAAQGVPPARLYAWATFFPLPGLRAFAPHHATLGARAPPGIA